MLRILSQLGEIGICIFQHRVLIAMAQLSLQAIIAGNVMVFSFGGTLRKILIRFVLSHDSAFTIKSGEPNR